MWQGIVLAAAVGRMDWSPQSQPWFNDMFHTSAACTDSTGSCTTAGLPTSHAVFSYLNYTKPRSSCAQVPIPFPPREPRTRNDFVIIDVTLVAYDIDTLEVRLFELAPVVDMFLIAESTTTQRGDTKPLFYNARRFAHLQGRIKRIIHRGATSPLRMATRPYDGESWTNEAAPLADLERELAALQSSVFSGKKMIVHFGDVDEFFARETLAAVTPESIGVAHVCGDRLIQYVNNVVMAPTVEPRKRSGAVATALLFTGKKLPRHQCIASVPGHQFHLSMFLSPVAQISKEISLAEGGGVMNRYDSAPNRLADPCSLFSLMVAQVRPCCADTRKTRWRESNHPIPQLLRKARASKRYPHLFGIKADCICPRERKKVL